MPKSRHRSGAALASPAMTHTVGIIGLGTVGSRFVEQFGRHPEFELVAAWDPDAAACTAHAGDVAIGTDAAAVIEASDLVYIAVPPLHHAGYVQACLDAGTAIFCEKPLGIDVAESRELVAAVEASGLPSSVNFVFGSAPSAVELASRVSSGSIGDLVRADLRLHFAEWPRAWHARAQWLALRDQGGWVREVASHFLFLAARILGPLRLDAGDVSYPDGPQGELSETWAAARWDGRDGPLTMAGTATGGGADVVDLTVRGSTGAVRILDWYRLQVDDGTGWSDLLTDDRATLGSDAYAAQLGQLARMMAGEDHTLATFGEALAVQELVEELLA